MTLELGPGRKAAICRELTKKFEEVIRAPLGDLVDQLADRNLKGEIVVVIDRNREAASEDRLEQALSDALLTMSVKDAAQAVSEALGLPKRKVYQKALELEKIK